jgi:hypothetical protein
MPFSFDLRARPKALILWCALAATAAGAAGRITVFH